ncbi:hypothetical protein AB1L42_09060 [Thalassoglobus sp. JC818]|uniref:hypothetical protein n=1 Tax=Thalassoglobus sp. JC818 TaxID=3232136 RepID=UPI003459724A
MRGTIGPLFQQFLSMGLWGAGRIPLAVLGRRLPDFVFTADTIGQQQKVYAKTRMSNCTPEYAVHRVVIKFILNGGVFPVIATLDPFESVRFGRMSQGIHELEHFSRWSSQIQTSELDDKLET